MKHCPRCGVDKPLDEFGKWKRYGGVSPECKRCLADGANRRYERRAEAAGRVFKRDPLDYFLARIDTSGDCWLWTGYAVGRPGKPGYGRVYYGGRLFLAHRLSYALHNGDLPDGALICHTCDNPPCVNPAHLYAGTVQTNARDAVERSLYVPKLGEANPGARLTTAQVQEIRARWGSGEKQADLGREFDITASHIYRIVHGEAWRHVA